MPKRSKAEIQVAFYLSKFGGKYPPKRLKVSHWNEAYRIFYESLNSGRTKLTFERSLKNSRDFFDRHFPENPRKGWKTTDGNPIKLTGINKIVFNEFSDKDENYIWTIIKSNIIGDTKVPSSNYDDLVSKLNHLEKMLLEHSKESKLEFKKLMKKIQNIERSS